MRTFTRKGYGRIYVKDADAIEAVDEIIKEMDEFEHSYMPPSFIAPFSEYPRVVYTHKFDALDLDALTAICWARGIALFAFDAGHNDWPQSALPEPPK